MTATVDEQAIAKKELAFNSLIEEGRRYFVINDDVLSNYQRGYNYLTQDVKLLRLASSQFGTASDCFILCAVATMGVCTLESIRGFLASLKRRHPELNVVETYKNTDFVTKRVQFLYKNGFLFKHIYEISATYNGHPTTDTVVLYSIDKDSHTFMNQKLRKSVPLNNWVMAKPIEELIGIAAATYVGERLIENDAFVDYREGVLYSKDVGVKYLPIEFKTSVKKADYDVTVLPFFGYMNKSIMTSEEYERLIIDKLSLVKSYIDVKANMEKEARVVVVCEDMQDIIAFGKWIVDTEILVDYLDKIYITSEPVIRVMPPEKGLIRYRSTGDTLTLDYAANPDFLK